MASEEVTRRRNVDLLPRARLFPAALRFHIRSFAALIRLAEAIADNTSLGADEQQARLGALAASLDGAVRPLWSEEAGSVAGNLRTSLATSGVPAGYARRIVLALCREAGGAESRTWEDLLAYCGDIAAPVGRHLLALLGESAAAAEASDAMCAAAHIVERLCYSSDHSRPFNRLCIPRQFIDDAMISLQHLRAPHARGQTRAVFDRVLDGVDRLLDNAEPLPRLVRSPGLARHAREVLCRTRILASRLRREDPLQGPIELNHWQRLLCSAAAVLPLRLRRP